ncbi:MAG: TonB family protein [Gemmatimonadota bacterium]|nr:TonB family protein [Gemmatimonadota bacterium]MDH3422224.1 TonB family protein [Gemmatimonadota bacterium]
MNTHHSAPALVVFDKSANDRMKATFNSWLWTSMIAATVIHFGTFALWPELTAADLSIDRGALTTIELPPEVELPPAPLEIARPAAPVMATTPVAEDVTIARTNFDSNPVSELPPPPDVAGTEVSRVTFTPFTVAPSILNTNEVVRAMQREYPATLRDSGIGGTVKVNFFVDERGQVLDTRIEEGSGYGTLDAAALAVADVIRFSPALNRDQIVAVWVVFPIVFRVDPRED